jgi:hypothetical protein
VKFVHQVGFITKKFVTMHGHMNIKFVKDFIGKDYLFIIKLIVRGGFFVDVKALYSIEVWTFFR